MYFEVLWVVVWSPFIFEGDNFLWGRGTFLNFQTTTSRQFSRLRKSDG